MQWGVERDAPRIAMVSESATTLWQPRRISAQEVARDFVVTAQAFADTFVQYIAAEELARDAAVLAHRKRESCAVVWAAIVATFEASGFTAADRGLVLPLVRDALMPFWHAHCGRDAQVGEALAERAAHFLRERDPDSQLKTATRIMNELMTVLDVEGAQLLPVRTLTALLAHRMLADLRRLDEVKANYSIE